MAEAALACGERLRVADSWILPRVGERVPCVRHGYCLVDALFRWNPADVAVPQSRRRKSRTRDELMQHLVVHSGRDRLTSLRRERFTLRLIADAEIDGLLIVEKSDDGEMVRLTSVGRRSYVATSAPCG
jgi:hypothetical protein